MTSPWEAARRVHLAEPFEAWWIEAFTDPPIGEYLDMRAAVDEATAEPSEGKLDALVRTIEPLIAAHNMTNRDGTPLTFVLRSMSARLISAIAAALKAVGDGASAAPLSTPGSSPAPGSRGSRSRRTTRSGG